MLRKTTRSLARRKFRAIALPDDIDSITSIDERNEVTAEESGLSDEAHETIWGNVQSLYQTGMHPLISFCLRRGGKTVFNRSIGYVRGDDNSTDTVIANIDTPVCLFSASKAISAILIHLLAEQNKIHLLDPISHYIPAFAAGGKGHITIYQLLSHRAGVPGLGDEIDPKLLFDREAALEKICAAQSLDNSGRSLAYHAVTGGFIVDELIRVTTGLTIQQYLDRHIRKPLGMRYFRYGLNTRDLKKAAQHRATGLPVKGAIGENLKNVLGLEYESVVSLSNSTDFAQSVLPSANIYATAEESNRFFQMLLDNGQYQGKQVIQPLTVYRAVQETGKARFDASLKLPMRYSPGFMLGGSPAGMYGRDSHYAYGHLGLSNVFCWADPERDIAVSLLTSGKPVLGTHLAALPRLLFSIAKQCPRTRDMASADLPAPL